MDQILKEYLVHTTGLLVCQSGNTFDTATAHQAANSGLGNTLDVVAKHPVVALGTSFSESIASFATYVPTRHDLSVLF